MFLPYRQDTTLGSMNFYVRTGAASAPVVRAIPAVRAKLDWKPCRSRCAKRSFSTTPRVLQIATIDAARFMKDDREYGSVAVGKVADLIVVDGKPAERLADLAKVETVIRGGRLYRVSDLTAAVGRPEP